MKYLIAEKFRSLQGEGVYSGTPMAFIRFVGCSVGKRICSACDTDFEEPVLWRGGGEFSSEQLIEWALPYEHICFTGGEPMDQDGLPSLMKDFASTYADHNRPLTFHVETSGTKSTVPIFDLGLQRREPTVGLWVCVSPKPGFLESEVSNADEIKVIMPGLGVYKNGVMQSPRRIQILNSTPAPTGEEMPWPTLDDALRWAAQGKTVFIQPRNERNEVNTANLRLCQDIVAQYPQLRLSLQLHKILHVQ